MHRVRRSRHIRESCPGDEASHIFPAIMLRALLSLTSLSLLAFRVL
jgi:hypothetical protein